MGKVGLSLYRVLYDTLPQKLCLLINWMVVVDLLFPSLTIIICVGEVVRGPTTEHPSIYLLLHAKLCSFPNSSKTDQVDYVTIIQPRYLGYQMEAIISYVAMAPSSPNWATNIPSCKYSFSRWYQSCWKPSPLSYLGACPFYLHEYSIY